MDRSKLCPPVERPVGECLSNGVGLCERGRYALSGSWSDHHGERWLLEEQLDLACCQRLLCAPAAGVARR